MPCYIVFHVGYAFALNALLDNANRFAGNGFCFVESSLDLVEVVAVDIDYVPAESSKFLINGLRRVYFLNSAVDLQVVVVNNSDQIV